MVKNAHKLNTSNVKHPNSRKTKQLIRHRTKVVSREKKKLSYFIKLNSFGEKILWFRDNLDPNVEEYTPQMVADLIQRYLSRLDDEMCIIKSVKSYEKMKHASREDQIRHTIENEKQEYYGCGLEVPDILDKTHLKELREWNGELRFLQNLSIVRYDKKNLEEINLTNIY